MGNRNRIPNTSKSESKQIPVVQIAHLDNYLYQNKCVTVDFSLQSAFVSCKRDLQKVRRTNGTWKERSFNNFLSDNDDFIESFRDTLLTVQKLSSHTMFELIKESNFRHCHKADDQEFAKAITEEIYKTLNKTDTYKQNIEEEVIYQIGFQDSIRLYGIVKGNVFKVTFIDYFHTFDYDERYNTRNVKHYKFCPVTTDLLSFAK